MLFLVQYTLYRRTGIPYKDIPNTDIMRSVRYTVNELFRMGRAVRCFNFTQLIPSSVGAIDNDLIRCRGHRAGLHVMQRNHSIKSRFSTQQLEVNFSNLVGIHVHRPTAYKTNFATVNTRSTRTISGTYCCTMT